MNDPNLIDQHVIELNADGILLDLRPGQKRRPLAIRNEASGYLQTNIFGGFEKSGKKKLLLFVHGGLNDRKQGMAHFWDDYGNILQGEYYPVFVVWPSGWSATYFEHLLWVRQGIKAETAGEKTFGIATSPLMLLADVGRALTRLPLVVANNTRSDVETVTPICNREGGAAVQQFQQLASKGYQVAIGDDYALTSDRAVRGVTYWATLPMKYLLASFIDGFGKGAWDDMLRRTQEAYPARMDARTQERLDTDRARQAETEAQRTATNATATRRYLSPRQQKRIQRYSAAGLPMFIEALRERQTNDPSFEVALVGHSMGTIILNRVVRDAEMEFGNIVYLGAACSVEDFSRAVLPYMKEHPRTQFYNLSLHPVAEAGEWYVSLADLPPRGSLLIWIDNFLSNPVAEQERTLGRWRNLFRSSVTGEPILRQFFDNDDASKLKERLHFRAFSVGFGDKDQIRKATYQWNEHPAPKDARERCDNPVTHGEFSEMPYWKPGFWWAPTGP